VFSKAASLEYRAHKSEEWDRQQEVVRDDTKKLVGEISKKIWADQTELDTKKTKEQAGRCQRESRRISDEHENNHACEHQRCEVFGDPVHCSGFSYLNSASMTCSSAAMRLMISETP